MVHFLRRSLGAAIKLLYTQKLASSDADFTPLAMQLKANGHDVYGFGERSTRTLRDTPAPPSVTSIAFGDPEVLEPALAPTTKAKAKSKAKDEASPSQLESADPRHDANHSSARRYGSNSGRAGSRSCHLPERNPSSSKRTSPRFAGCGHLVQGAGPGAFNRSCRSKGELRIRSRTCLAGAYNQFGSLH